MRGACRYVNNSFKIINHIAIGIQHGNCDPIWLTDTGIGLLRFYGETRGTYRSFNKKAVNIVTPDSVNGIKRYLCIGRLILTCWKSDRRPENIAGTLCTTVQNDLLCFTEMIQPGENKFSILFGGVAEIIVAYAHPEVDC